MMSANSTTHPSASVMTDHGPILDARTRLRLGLQLQALYEPVLDEVLDPRLAELLLQRETDRGATDVGPQLAGDGVPAHLRRKLCLKCIGKRS